MKLKLSDVKNRIGESITLNLNAKVAKIKKEGKPLIHLGGGEPQFPAPQSCVDAIIAKANTRNLKYTAVGGTPEIKNAIVKYTKKNYGKEIKPSNVVVSAGAKQSLFNFLIATVDKGDEVIFPAPYWVSYPDMVQLAGGKPVIVKPKEGSFQPDIEAIKNATTEKTTAIIINSPNNPSGTVIDESFIKAVVEFCEEKGIYLVMDDIYNKLVFEGKEAPSAFKFAKDCDNIVIVNGVSKIYGLTGVRIGWAIGNEEICKLMTKIQAQSTSCPSDLSQSAAQGVLEGSQDCIEELRTTLEANKKVALEELAKIPHLKINEPGGTFYSLIDFSYYNKSSIDLAEFLLEKALVAVVPGVAFGMEGHLRISYCASKENVIEGISRIKKALEELK